MKNYVLLICGLLASSVCGHMQMSKPYPIRSPLNKDASGQKDYSYTSPLSTSGSDYPCKGYADDPFNSVADYSPGQSYEMDIAGSASHGGGSCQIALSYDKGKTWKVIKSIIGGCPLSKKYNFKIPSDAPSGQALLAWTWFNKIGNREMYMNCAQVTIKGGSSKRAHPRDLTSKLAPRTAFDSLPPIFLANIGAEGECTTIESQEVNFPMPGDDVEGSVSGKGYTCKSTAPFLGGGSSDSSSGSSSSSVSSTAPTGTSTSATSTSSGNETSDTPSPTAGSYSGFSGSSGAAVTSAEPARAIPTPDTATSATPAPVVAPSSAPKTGGYGGTDAPAGGACNDGEIICSADGNSFSMCNHGKPVPMGQVAAGTTCQNGAIKAAQHYIRWFQ